MSSASIAGRRWNGSTRKRREPRRDACQSCTGGGCDNRYDRCVLYCAMLSDDAKARETLLSSSIVDSSKVSLVSYSDPLISGHG
jgi:hypothetical protein